MKGERPEEIVGLAETMRAHAVPFVDARPPSRSTRAAPAATARARFNISSAAALVIAACGVRVAKHGNRSVSSRCGSADVLEALGVNVAASPAVVERCLDEAGIAFLFAPTFHPSMRHAAPTRRELGLRTAFNLLGPLTNPARPSAAAGGRAAARADRAARAGAAAARVRARLGRARRGRARRDLDDRLHEGVGVPRRCRADLLRAPVRLRPAQGAARARSRAAMPRTTRRSSRRVLDGERRARRATSCCSMPAPALFVAGARRIGARRHRRGGRGDRQRARARATLERLVDASQSQSGSRRDACGARPARRRSSAATRARVEADAAARCRSRRCERARRGAAAPRRLPSGARAARRRRTSSPSASGGRRRAACSGATTTRWRSRAATRRPAPPPSRC